jgi:hypothetical protein
MLNFLSYSIFKYEITASKLFDLKNPLLGILQSPSGRSFKFAVTLNRLLFSFNNAVSVAWVSRSTMTGQDRSGLISCPVDSAVTVDEGSSLQ